MRTPNTKQDILKRYQLDRKTGCWNWTGVTVRNGYGQFVVRCKRQYAHRTSWEIHNGDIPAGLFVLHKCDNRKCINPEHLFLGTNSDNMQDMLRKGRGTSPLTIEQVKEIRRAYAAKELSHSKLAKKFKVNQTSIYRILHRERWALVG